MPDDITILTVRDADSRVLYVDSASSREGAVDEVVERLRNAFPAAVLIQARGWTHEHYRPPGCERPVLRPRLAHRFTIPLIT